VQLDVKNTGRYDGDEVVQLYLKELNPKEVRPIRELRNFQRIHLKKGETQTVRFSLDRNALSYWTSDNNFVVDPGEYEIQIGASSADIRRAIRFTVKEE
jgi:beta-glucosidase